VSRLIDTIQAIANLINSREKHWYALRSEFNELLGEGSYKTLIEEFELKFNTLPSKKIPHYSLVFYLALLIAKSEDTELEKIVIFVKEKKSYQMMKTGLYIFLSSKSEGLKYEVELTADKYQNKYEYISRFTGSVPSYEIEFRGYLLLLELIYHVDKNDFWRLLSADQQNVIFLCFLLNGRWDFTYEEITPFLSSEDELKSNGCFYYIMNNFSYKAIKYQRNRSEENAHILEEEVKQIEAVFKKLDDKHRVYFIINYLFEEKIYPSFFSLELKKANINLILDELKEKDLQNLYDLIKIQIILEVLQHEELENLFITHFLDWIKVDSNTYMWQRVKGAIGLIYGLLDPKKKDLLRKELTTYKKGLCISSFDRQIRMSQFQKEKDKEKVIDEILSLNFLSMEDGLNG
jgi:hypothetical protein